MFVMSNGHNPIFKTQVDEIASADAPQK